MSPWDQKVALIARKGSMASIQNSQTRRLWQVRQKGRLRPSQTYPSHYRQLTRTPLSDIALVTSDRQVGCLVMYQSTVAHPPTPLPHPRKSPRATTTHARDTRPAHTDSHSLHRFRIPPARPPPAQRPRADQGVERHPTTLPPARRAPCPRILSPF